VDVDVAQLTWKRTYERLRESQQRQVQLMVAAPAPKLATDKLRSQQTATISRMREIEAKHAPAAESEHKPTTLAQATLLLERLAGKNQHLPFLVSLFS
jgi:hypothetical protein